MATNAELITQLYIGYYDRAPDPEGLNYWLGRMNAGVSIASIANSFATSPEAIATYPFFAFPNLSSASSFISQIYQNVFGRAPDADGLNYYSNKLSTGATSVGNILAEILGNASTNTGSNDQKFLANKVAVGLDWANKAAAQPGFTFNAAAKNSAATIVDTVTADAATVDAAKAAATNFFNNVQSGSFSLTVGLDSIVGTTGNDTITAAEIANGATTTATFTAGDTIDGGAGVDTLKVLQSAAITGVPGGATITNVEKISLAGGAGVTFNTSSISGVTSLESTQSVGALSLTAATTTDVSVSGASSTISVNGGKDIAVTDATADQSITIGATTVNAGKVTVTDSKVGNTTIAVDGGTDVAINATGSVNGSAITVGQGGAATDLPTGTVTVSSAHTAVAATSETLASVTVSGGSAVTVNQTADTSKAAADKTGAILTQGAVIVTGGNTTAAVTVTQAKSTAEVAAVDAVAGVTETASIKFGALKSGDAIILGGDGDANLEVGEIQFTAAKDLTAAEVAQAFANYINGTYPAAGDTQGSSPVANGIFTNSATTSAFTGWTSGAASGDTVVFTSTTASSPVTDLAVNLVNTSGNSSASVVTTTAGSAATAAKTGVLGVITGAVTIDDNATASIKTVTLDGYGATTIGGTTALSKLESLSLANSGGVTAGASNAAVSVDSGTVTTLALALNNVKGNVTLDADLKTLNVTTSGADSASALTAAGVETLTVSGDKAASFTSDLAALKTVTVSGSAGLTLSGNESDTLTSVNTSATTGTVSATIDGTKATYTGGAGVDKVTVANSNTAISKAIDLGAGNDTLTLNVVSGTVAVPTVDLKGGEGTDTIAMSAASAVAVSANGSFAGKIDGFEKLSIGKATATGTVNLANLDNINYVVSANSDSVTAAATKASFTVTLSAGATSTDTVVFNGGNYTATTTLTAGQLALQLAGLTYTDWDVKSVSGASITFEAKNAGTATTVPAATDFTFTDTDTSGSVPTFTLSNQTAGAAPGAAAAALTLDNLASGGTLEVTGDGAGAIVNIANASTGTADVLNLVLSSAGNLSAGTVTAANVETINISTVDTEVVTAPAVQTKNVDSLTLTADKATAVNLTGGQDLTLTMTGSTKVTSIDGSAMTGNLTVTSVNTSSATTIKGGAGNDVLTAATGNTADVLIGGAGNDKLVANAGLTTMTGGDGHDLFVVNVASTNVNSYATITDFTSNDLIQFNATTDTFVSAKVSLGSTAVFQDYANAAMNALDANQAGWFQFGGDTYVVLDAGANSSTFVNGQDMIVKLTGLVDLTNASFNNTHDTIGL